MGNTRHRMKGGGRIQDAARGRVDRTGQRREVARWKMNAE